MAKKSFKRRFYLGKLSYKFLLPLSLVFILIFGIFTIYLVNNFQTEEEEEFWENFEHSLQLIANTSTSYLWNYHYTGLGENATYFISDQNLARIVITDDQDTVIVEMEDEEAMQLGEIFLAKRSIYKNENLLGHVEIAFTDHFYQARVRELRNHLFSISGLVLLTMIILISLISRRLFRPLHNIMDFARKIAEGNLGITDLEIRGRDEIAHLASALNTMAGNIRDNVHQMQGASGKVSSASREISSSTSQLSSGAEDQANSVEELTATMQEMSASIQEVSKNISETSDHADEVTRAMEELEEFIENVKENITQVNQEAEAVETAARKADQALDETEKETLETDREIQETMTATKKGHEQVQGTVADMDEINNTVQELAGVMNKLGGSADQIGNIVQVIDDIAEQTSLLALNASIEAARAGEHGKGFAVVASSIGDLASRSQEATGNISKLIKGILQEVERAVVISNQGREKVQDGALAVQESGKTFASIHSAVQKVTQRIGVIAGNTPARITTSGSSGKPSPVFPASWRSWPPLPGNRPRGPGR